MVRELNISLITGIIVGNLPIWQWDTRTGCVIGIFTITGIVCGIILWLEEEPHSGNCKGSVIKWCCMK